MGSHCAVLRWELKNILFTKCYARREDDQRRKLRDKIACWLWFGCCYFKVNWMTELELALMLPNDVKCAWLVMSKSFAIHMYTLKWNEVQAITKKERKREKNCKRQKKE